MSVTAVVNRVDSNGSTSAAPARQQPSVTVGRRGLELRSLDELWRFATCVAKSGLAPKGVESPEAIVVAVQMGAEIGLTPMASLQNIAVINGRPSLWGDAMLAVCRASGVFDESRFEEVVNDKSATCTVCRIGGKPITRTFTIDDAKKAGLSGKQGPWSQYPQRMMQMRARSFALRDGFSDYLRGIRSTEEERDSFDSAIEVTAVESRPLRASEMRVGQLDALTQILTGKPESDKAPENETVVETELSAEAAGESVSAEESERLLFEANLQDGIDETLKALAWSPPNAAGKLSAFVKSKFGLAKLDDCSVEQKREVLTWLEGQLER